MKSLKVKEAWEALWTAWMELERTSSRAFFASQYAKDIFRSANSESCDPDNEDDRFDECWSDAKAACDRVLEAEFAEEGLVENLAKAKNEFLEVLDEFGYSPNSYIRALANMVSITPTMANKAGAEVEKDTTVEE